MSERDEAIIEAIIELGRVKAHNRRTKSGKTITVSETTRSRKVTPQTTRKPVVRSIRSPASKPPAPGKIKKTIEPRKEPLPMRGMPPAAVRVARSFNDDLDKLVKILDKHGGDIDAASKEEGFSKLLADQLKRSIEFDKLAEQFEKDKKTLHDYPFVSSERVVTSEKDLDDWMEYNRWLAHYTVDDRQLQSRFEYYIQALALQARNAGFDEKKCKLIMPSDEQLLAIGLKKKKDDGPGDGDSES